MENVTTQTDILRGQPEPVFGTFGWALWKIAQGHTAQRNGWIAAYNYVWAIIGKGRQLRAHDGGSR